MKAYNAANIRNIALAGHGGRGKTTLAEAMLYTAKATERLGRVADGNTVLDFDPEEKRRKTSVSTAVAPLEWKDTKINIIDTPGLFDFAGGVSEGVRAAECVLIVTAAGSGYDVGAEKAFKAANQRKISKMFAVTRCDAENTDFYKTFEALKAEHETELCPVVVPYMVGDAVKAYVNLATGKAYEYNNGKATEVAFPEDDRVSEMKDIFNEAVANADEELMEKFFEGEEFTHEEVARGISEGVADGTVYPVFACSGYNTDAVDLLLDSIAVFAPSAADHAGEGDIKCDENGDLAAICFKTVADPFVGKMSFFKVISGKITSDAPAFCARTGESERMGKIITVRGGKQEDSPCIPAGDIGVVTKLAGIVTGDTLCSPKKVVELEKVDFPAPCLSMAVKVRKKGEEEKVAAGLNRLMEEDPTIKFETNKETREQVISGLGEQHLDVVLSKLKSKFGVEVDLTVPKVAYRETIRKTVQKQGRHKKQSGGHGQFGDVWIRFEPYDGEEDFVFTSDEVVGGAVPKNYFPAVEKGLRDCIAKGMIAGYPMVGIKAALYFGSYHPVDSSEMAFKTAAQLAFKAAIPEAQPTILEPIGTLKAYMPDDNLGDIMGDITKRRGRVLGMGPADEPKMQELIAEVPMAEMGDFSTILRSVTAGRGHFSMEFARYEDAPANVAQKVIEDAKANAEEE
ncbi:MAG: elongation factor G [Clostridiales bacterium]|nr:elongation factor G [Clostridiales bacterium]